jgi:hypothetical protein
MLQQIVICLTVGLAGMAYLIVYERHVMVPVLRTAGPYWLVRQHKKWTHERDSVFGLLWPAAEEAVARGIPMLLVTDPVPLFVVLMLLNIGFTIAHRDRDVIGTLRWLLRYAHGLVVILAAVWTYNLYVCFAIHAAWNLWVTLRRWDHDNRDRIVVWTEGPLEILVGPGSQPSKTWRILFRSMRSERINPKGGRYG